MTIEALNTLAYILTECQTREHNPLYAHFPLCRFRDYYIISYRTRKKNP